MTYRLWKNAFTEQTVSFLNLLADRARRTGKNIISVLDDGSCYTCKQLTEEVHRLREWIQVFPLPTHPSESLNLIENVWTHLQRI